MRATKPSFVTPVVIKEYTGIVAAPSHKKCESHLYNFNQNLAQIEALQVQAGVEARRAKPLDFKMLDAVITLATVCGHGKSFKKMIASCEAKKVALTTKYMSDGTRKKLDKATQCMRDNAHIIEEKSGDTGIHQVIEDCMAERGNIICLKKVRLRLDAINQ